MIAANTIGRIVGPNVLPFLMLAPNTDNGRLSKERAQAPRTNQVPDQRASSTEKIVTILHRILVFETKTQGVLLEISVVKLSEVP